MQTMVKLVKLLSKLTVKSYLRQVSPWVLVSQLNIWKNFMKHIQREYVYSHFRINCLFAHARRQLYLDKQPEMRCQKRLVIL